MKTHFLTSTTLLVTALAVTVGCATSRKDIGSADYPNASHQDAGNAHGGAAMKLPPGWTEADMQACMVAGTPGAMQQKLMRGIGHWSGTDTMWMAPGMDPTKSSCTSTVSSMMDGRFTKCEFSGDMPGMGPFSGLGFDGYDNVSQKFISTWMDNMSTGIMTGDGTMSNDGSTLTWNFHYTCPITKKPTTMREVQHFTGDNAMTLDMYGPDPKTGKEYQMMHIELTRTSP